MRFLAYTGLRWGAMAALRVCDFDMLRRPVNVSRSVTEASGAGLVFSTPKTYERRSVPFPAALADELAALMVGKDRDALVFADLRGGVLPNSNWRARVFAPAVAVCQKADEFVPDDHTTRSAAHGGEFVRQRGRECQSAAKNVGPRQSINDADTYGDLFDADLDEVADRLDVAIKSTAYPLRTGRSETVSTANA